MNYKDILESTYFYKAYREIEELKKEYPVNHGFIHIHNVLNNIKYIRKIFDLNDEELNLVLIAGALHDIGYLKGREDHAYNGAILASEYLKDKLPLKDVETIAKIIRNHGGKKESDYQDKLSLVLLLSDKLDFDKTRYKLDPRHSYNNVFLSIEKVKLKKQDKKLKLEITTSDKSLFNEMYNISFFNKLKNVFNLLEKTTQVKTNIVVKEHKK